jgi:hypothetical protein
MSAKILLFPRRRPCPGCAVCTSPYARECPEHGTWRLDQHRGCPFCLRGNGNQS